MLIIQEFKRKEQNETGLRSKVLSLIALGCFQKLLSTQTGYRLGRQRVHTKQNQSSLLELNVTLNELPFLSAKNGCLTQRDHYAVIPYPVTRAARSQKQRVCSATAICISGHRVLLWAQINYHKTVLQWFLFLGSHPD